MASEPPRPEKRSRLPANGGTIALIVVAVIITLFAVLNLNSVHVNWIIGSGSAPLIVVIAISILLGAAGTALFERVSARRRKP
jgi:uncharacterized integral membrane protein